MKPYTVSSLSLFKLVKHKVSEPNICDFSHDYTSRLLFLVDQPDGTRFCKWGLIVKQRNDKTSALKVSGWNKSHGKYGD